MARQRRNWQLPFVENSSDLVTAFETIYFWPGLADCFREVYRVLKPGGMTIHNATQILTALNQVGFREAQVDKNSKGWICVTARK